MVTLGIVARNLGARRRAEARTPNPRPRANRCLEEILLRRRQLETDYEAGFNFGFRYRFGSIFNNVVNTRFGGGPSQDHF